MFDGGCVCVNVRAIPTCAKSVSHAQANPRAIVRPVTLISCVSGTEHHLINTSPNLKAIHGRQCYTTLEHFGTKITAYIGAGGWGALVPPHLGGGELSPGLKTRRVKINSKY